MDEEVYEGMKALTPRQLRARIEEAIDLAVKYGSIDGAHHKAWVIDQMVRALAGSAYSVIIAGP